DQGTGDGSGVDREVDRARQRRGLGRARFLEVLPADGLSLHQGPGRPGRGDATMSAARIKMSEAALKLYVPPPGARAARPKKPKPTPLPPGTVVAEFVVPGDAVPWRAPAVLKGVAITPKHVKAWKAKVATATHAAGYGQARGADPYGGRVRVELLFFKAHKTKKRWGTRWDTRPDIDNLCKGFVDALTGNVFKVAPKRKKGEPKVRALNLPPSPIG